MGPGPRKGKRKTLAVTDSAACVPPDGFALVPVGKKAGDQLVWDPTTSQWKVVPYPTEPKGEQWTAGPDGPYWAKPPGALAAPKNGDKPL